MNVAKKAAFLGIFFTAAVIAAEAQESPTSRQAETRCAESPEHIEEMIRAWDFRGAGAALAKLRFEDKDLTARLARRRDEVKRLGRLKARMVERINKTNPWLQKGMAIVPGSKGKKTKVIGRCLVNADDRGITVKAITVETEKAEVHTWQSLDGRLIEQIVQLTIDGDSANDRLAAGILALARKDAASAVKHLEKARALGADIEKYLDVLAAAAFAKARQRMEKKQFSEATAALNDIEKKYAKTSWFAAHKDEFDTVRQEAAAAATEAEAEKIYAQAAKFFKKKMLWELKPLVEKLQADYGETKVITDTKRKPSLTEMAKAVASLGPRVTVARKVKADFRTIQAAVDVVTKPNSKIEVIDASVYKEKVRIEGKEKAGLLLSARPKVGATIDGGGSSGVCITVKAPSVGIDGFTLTNAKMGVRLEAPKCSIRNCAIVRRIGDSIFQPAGVNSKGFVIERSVLRGSLFMRGVIRQSVVYGKRLQCFHIQMVDSVIHGNIDNAAGVVGLTNCLIIGDVGCFWTAQICRCTILGGVTAGRGAVLMEDSICESLRLMKTGEPTLSHCNLFGQKERLPRGVAKHCFSANPRFRSAKRGDYRLGKKSLCRSKASDGKDIGCRFTPELLEARALAKKYRKYAPPPTKK